VIRSEGERDSVGASSDEWIQPAGAVSGTSCSVRSIETGRRSNGIRFA
jgi:hypothetical protein